MGFLGYCFYNGEKTNTKNIVPRGTCEETKVETVLKQKRLQRAKWQLSYEAPDQQMSQALRKIEFSFFHVVVDVSEALEVGEVWMKLKRHLVYLSFL